MRDLFKHVRKTGLAAALGLVFAASVSGGAQAANPLEMNFGLFGPRYDGVLPSCESALGTISSQFAEKENTFWNSALQITGYDRVRETGFRPWTSDNIPRRYCSARAMLNDGKPRTVEAVRKGLDAEFDKFTIWPGEQGQSRAA